MIKPRSIKRLFTKNPLLTVFVFLIIILQVILWFVWVFMFQFDRTPVIFSLVISILNIIISLVSYRFFLFSVYFLLAMPVFLSILDYVLLRGILSVQ
ncbi:hypothetical protein CO100_00425 [Candidatus Berkelbacteria bacterium CG_4_9_14_3_um_filter_33_5]|uniref:Uncharacterized protein n=1 Tax=Candidatus Berkelbacteria bacterium CG_4_10_14_0_2_um_filter_35_9_33_12 TaxID=1974499 RepID=A0A2M7W4I6_9BACT|nr:MAG: hypothetical protein COT76_01350 [Candidatus Berkelbacteria bacterium CG10_big_fil_rev_8_21_14_0_10_33_10]PJA20704.1 MAG: hypothetical protein COX60_00950 [Candidatus Berkelbacteria bacterium CG_4_10_14_0_2_um_filter_35_9_33_12]PJB52146.1 MAG: hypothetical protein CO100_00425 [Candidatus Berkelbacteria bacterium CG_4_9_14_3_um_filter_33_5]